MPQTFSADGVIKTHCLAANVKTSIVGEKIRAIIPTSPHEVQLVQGRVIGIQTSGKAAPLPLTAGQSFLGRSNVESRHNPYQTPQITCRDSERLSKRSQ